MDGCIHEWIDRRIPSRQPIQSHDSTSPSYALIYPHRERVRERGSEGGIASKEKERKRRRWCACAQKAQGNRSNQAGKLHVSQYAMTVGLSVRRFVDSHIQVRKIMSVRTAGRPKKLSSSSTLAMLLAAAIADASCRIPA